MEDSSSPEPLASRFDLMLDAETYRRGERERILLHESRAAVNRETVSEW